MGPKGHSGSAGATPPASPPPLPHEQPQKPADQLGSLDANHPNGHKSPPCIAQSEQEIPGDHQGQPQNRQPCPARYAEEQQDDPQNQQHISRDFKDPVCACGKALCALRQKASPRSAHSMRGRGECCVRFPGESPRRFYFSAMLPFSMPNRRQVFSVAAAASSSTGIPLTWATRWATKRTKEGSLRLPRMGSGAR